MRNKEEILHVLKESKKEYQKYGIKSIGLFGSSLRGDYTAESDIDILIDLEDNSTLTLFSLIKIEQEISIALEEKVDLVIKSNLKPNIGNQILSEVIYA